MAQLSEEQYKTNYRVLIRSLYQKLARYDKQWALHDYRLQITENEIQTLESISPKNYYVWSLPTSALYHPKLLFQWGRESRIYGIVRISIPYGMKRFNRKIELAYPDTFDEKLDMCLETLDTQWSAYQETEAHIKTFFDVLEVSEIGYEKQNSWFVKFNDNNHNFIKHMFIKYNTKNNTFLFQHRDIKDSVTINRILEIFR